MASAIRVLFSPLRSKSRGERNSFDGALIGLRAFGGGDSKLTRAGKQPAKLTLKATFFDRARKPLDTEERPIAHLEGSIELQGDGSPVFFGDETEDSPKTFTVDDTADKQAPDGATSRRILRLELDSTSFRCLSTKHKNLILKLDAKRFAFMEVRAQLEVAGATEAPFEVNDVLDIAITKENPPRIVEGATIGVHVPWFDEIPEGAALIITPDGDEAVTFPLRDGLDLGDGLLYFTVEEPQPGKTYSAEMRANAAAPLTVVFEGVELYQLVAESEGQEPAPLMIDGADPLDFEAPAEELPRERATEPGPKETSADQLASFKNKAGTDVFA
jgi:hypothetical protein